MDAALRLRHCSSRAVLVCWPLDQVRGRSLPELLPACWPDSALKNALARLQSGHELQNRAELTLRREDGSTLHCVWFNSALLGPRENSNR
jgi:PAS domain-containing protein